MNKTILRSFCILLCVASSQFTNAQWVTIPTGFATYIQTYVAPSAIKNGNQLDTTNATILGIQNMTISVELSDMTGIQYFKGLQNLVANSNNLPRLPANLLTCQVSDVDTITAAFPNTLTVLKLSYSSFIHVPAFPAGLRKLVMEEDYYLTTIPSLPLGLNYLDLSSSENIYSLPSIPNGVDTLLLNYCTHLQSFPDLPASAIVVDVSNTYFSATYQLTNLYSLVSFTAEYCTNITSLPQLPSNLTYLDVMGCQISNTPYPLPTFMVYLDISNNPINSITLPDTVITLLIHDMGFVSLFNFDSIEIGQSVDMDNFYGDAQYFLENIVPYYNSGYGGVYISARNCGLYQLPNFNLNLYIGSLDLSGNDLQYLNGLPAAGSFTCAYCGISEFYYYYNSYQFNAYPGWLDLDHNDIASLTSPLPGFDYLNLASNQISNVTIALSANQLVLDSNQIYCLPWLNSGYGSDCATYGDCPYISLVGNPINCLPNIPDTNYGITPPMGVCQPGNSNGCLVYSQVNGITFNDSASNGILSGRNDTAINNIYVQMQPGNYMTISDSKGNYFFNCQIDTNYSISGAENWPYRTITTPPFAATFSGLGQIDSLQNIGVHTLPDVNDLVMYLTPYEAPRPGFYQTYGLTAVNLGTTIENGTVVMYFDPALFYQSSTPAGVVSGNTITWQLNKLQPLTAFNATANFIVPVPVPLGALIPAGAYALGNIPDTTLQNNHDTITQVAVGSYDPNNKTVSPSTNLSREQIAEGQYLDYTVRFQNTGTASAIDVTVVDTLSLAFNFASFQFVTASSNQYVWNISNSVLTVTFKGINLPDSGSDQAGSHGFFRYRIKLSPYDTSGTQIENKAYIIFDNNPAIVTNNTTNSVINYLLKQPVSQSVCSGEPVTLFIVPDTGVIGVSWYQNGVPLGVFTDTLHMDSATVNNSGFYACYFTTRAGGPYPSNSVGVQVYDHSLSPNLTLSSSAGICGANGYLQAISTTPDITQSFTWYVNNQQVTNFNYFDGNTLYTWPYHTGDSVRVIMTDSTVCNRTTTVQQNTVFHFVAGDTGSFVIIGPNGPVCPGSGFLFSTTYKNIGSPTYYWYHNNNYLGYSSSMIIDNLQNNDIIEAYLYNYYYVNGGCTVVPNYVLFDTIHTNTTPAVTVTTNSDTACPGQSVQYIANLSNQGNNVTYIWHKNGSITGSNQNSFTDNSVANGDQVQCTVITNGCSGITIDTVISTPFALTVTSNIHPSLSIQLTTPGINGNCINNAYSASPVNAGANPAYQWYRNGVALKGQTEQTDTLTGLNAGDTITCSMVPGLSCNNTPVVSGPLYFTGNGHYNYTGVYSSNGGFYCPGSKVTFSTGNESAPASYLSWYKNGIMEATGYSYTTDGTDTGAFQVYVRYGAYQCFFTTVSDTITTIPVNPSIHITGNIIAAPYASCNGSMTLSFNPSPPGVPGNYEWTYNGGTYSGNSTFSPSSLTNNSVIAGYYSPVSQLAGCVSGGITDSFVVQLISNVPTVSISTPTNSLCGGNQTKTFTAQNKNGGAYPVYQWIKNGVKVGTNSPTYTASLLNIGDSIKCTMSSDAPCASTQAVTSNTIVIGSGGTIYTPTISISPTVVTACKGSPVTFNSTITFGGSNPVYVWQVNGVTAGSGSSFKTTSLNNLDKVSCTLYSNIGCLNADSVVSNSVTVSITNTITSTISIQGPSTDCNSLPVSYTSSITNGGNNPVYTWLRNGVAIGSSTGYTDNSPVNGEQIACVLQPNVQCPAHPTDTSNIISLAVSSTVVPSLSVSSNAPGAICSGTNVQFTAYPTNGGTSPTYNWLLNGASVQSGSSATYNNSALRNGDSVAVILTSNAACANPITVRSIPIIMQVNPLPAIAISSNLPNKICSGELGTFRATATNQGASPVYTWKLDGVTMQTGSSSVYSKLFEANTIYGSSFRINCLLSSNSCSSPVTVSSDTIHLAMESKPIKTNVSGQSKGVCGGSTWKYTCQSVVGATLYLWEVPKGCVIDSGQNTTSLTVTFPADYDSAQIGVAAYNNCGLSTVTYLTVKCSTRADETADEDIPVTGEIKLNVYPNPNNGQMYIDLQQADAATVSYKVFNTMGQIVHEYSSAEPVANFQQWLDLGTQPSGMYFIQLRSGEAVLNRSVVVTK